MPIEPLFRVFAPLIEERFAAARADGGLETEAVAMRIEEEPMGNGKERAEFLSIDPSGPVRITWNAIASLWALNQGAARLSRRMFEGNRKKVERLSVDDDPEIRRGLDSLELAQRFRTEDIPAAVATLDKWPSWAPDIDANPQPGSDNDIGLRFFLGALEWMFRHEIAHLALHHADREKEGTLTYRDAEVEADAQATKWLRGSLQADPNREKSARPAREELNLEWRGLSIGLGIIWTAMFEGGLAVRSPNYPPVAERLAMCLDMMELREDSGAAEILSHIIQAWIGPEETWAPTGGYLNAQDALNEATLRLHRFLNS